MTIDILICTIDNGIKRIPHMLMPPQEGISYVVSMQYTDKAYLDLIPDVLKERMCETDVNSFAEGKCYAFLSVLTQDLRSRGVEKLRSMVRHYHISHRRTLLFEPD